jgi:two-component system sensor histidine kinase QseC
VSLRRRLLVTLGLSLSVLWLLAAGWLLLQLHHSVRRTLDQRLEASAHMVAGLVSQLPSGVWQQKIKTALSTPPGKGVACQISSMRGDVLLRTRGDSRALLDHTPRGFSQHTRNGTHWRTYSEAANGLVITVADRLHERRQLQTRIVLAAVLPFLLALVGSLIIGWWGIRRGLAPLEGLRGELARRDPETLTPVVVDAAPAELVPVIDTLNELLLRTDDAMQREQRFTSNAAHELRTPLTAIKTHVQLARRVEGTRARDALENAEAGVARLQRTLEQLLLLSRVESAQPWPEAPSASVAETVQAAIADLGLPESFAADAAADDTPLALPVELAVELAVAALRNLLDNAVQHSGAAASVALHLLHRSDAVIFEVIDAGAGAAPPEPRRFERGRRSTGSGLGLAITMAIASRFGGALEMIRREPRGLCARLTLPRHGHGSA